MTTFSTAPNSDGTPIRKMSGIVGGLALIGLLWLVLMVSGQRVLISEVKVEPGENYVVPEYGNLGTASQASLVCKYFTGRKVVTTVVWYAQNNILGKDECPFLTSQQ